MPNATPCIKKVFVQMLALAAKPKGENWVSLSMPHLEKAVDFLEPEDFSDLKKARKKLPKE